MDLKRGGVGWQTTRARSSGSLFFIVYQVFEGNPRFCPDVVWSQEANDGWQTMRARSSGNLDFVPGFPGKFAHFCQVVVWSKSEGCLMADHACST